MEDEKVKSWQGNRLSLYKGYDGDYILCDMTVNVYGGCIKICDAKVKYDKNNVTLINKLKHLRKRRRVYIIFNVYPKNGCFLARRDLSNATIIDILLEKEYKAIEYEKCERAKDKMWLSLNPIPLGMLSQFAIADLKASGKI